MITTVYAATNEDLNTFHRSSRWPVMIDWLKANGINPSDVPLATPVTVEESIRRKPVIRYWVYVRDEDGKKLVADDEPVMEEQSTPLMVSIPTALIA